MKAPPLLDCCSHPPGDGLAAVRRHRDCAPPGLHAGQGSEVRARGEGAPTALAGGRQHAAHRCHNPPAHKWHPTIAPPNRAPEPSDILWQHTACTGSEAFTRRLGSAVLTFLIVAAGAGLQYGLAVAGEEERKNRCGGGAGMMESAGEHGTPSFGLPATQSTRWREPCVHRLHAPQPPPDAWNPFLVPRLHPRQAVGAVPLQHGCGGQPGLLLLGRLHRLRAGGGRTWGLNRLAVVERAC